jgi:hypothetical protein
MPASVTRSGAWTSEQAKQYQSASSKLHGLSHKLVHANPEEQRAVRDELRQAKAEYDGLRSQLDSARSRPQRWSWALRIAGILAFCIGGALLYTSPEPE